ncbi:DUF2442 domain-containing protein [Sphingomonas sp. BIUV-7]|uniref:DUF2442 domain-containing protein n=1 Tax=Sphingomonas natans TaxID=3063330 RepID=A0ABT8YEB4_9SPHN|nr:DUF2442 domain-containing protein [Sphingomonas sp. BIUV-7]MDO6416687.1 DUF2442 domain-containing protein [Sphingomonas sp. BIUV-7]
MAELSDADYDSASRKGEIELRTKPRARTARYDRASGRIVIDLVSGATFAFPARLAQGLESATDEQIGEVEILGAGFGLHWEALDADFTVEGLLAGRFGTARYMAERFGPEWNLAAAE